MMGNYCVYMHVAPNGKKYIGVTKRSPAKRWENGRGYIHNDYFYRAIVKYGWDSFEHTIIDSGLTLEKAESLERELIAEHGTTNKRYGFNIESGGVTSKTLSEETKAKISVAKTGKKHGPMSDETKNKLSSIRKRQGNFRTGVKHSEKTKRKISESQKGKTVFISDETRKKISESLTGIKRSEETRKRMSAAQKGPRGPMPTKWVAVVQINVETDTIVQVFSSMTQASKATGARYTGISRCCRGEIKSTGGYRWEYAAKDIGRREAS